MKIKNDKYRHARGGTSKVYELFCSDCKNSLLKYQKDGSGNLIRCYLNRILFPKELSDLQFYCSTPKQVPNLVCKKCNKLIATPMIYSDGRLAYRLNRGSWFKKNA